MFLSGPMITQNFCVNGEKMHINGAGIDLRLDQVGKLDHRICALQHITEDDITWLKLNKRGEFTLQSGRAYIAVTEETITAQTTDHPPVPLLGIIQPRSSLITCGVFMGTAFVDPGFHGRLRVPIFCLNGSGFYLKPGERICQIAFAPVDEAAEMYSGHYQDMTFGLSTEK